MRFDWTINVGDILGALAIISSILWAAIYLRDDLRDLKRMLREFPPHRHIDHERIVYPTGMRPQS